MKRGDWVNTPGGVGKVWKVSGNAITVEMDYQYLVTYRVNDVTEYTPQEVIL